jgi:hypothetical protein
MLPTPEARASSADLHLVVPNEPPAQQCGRCRLLFAGDPTLHPIARPDWWLCPPCRAILLGRNHATGGASRRHAGETP